MRGDGATKRRSDEAKRALGALGRFGSVVVLAVGCLGAQAQGQEPIPSEVPIAWNRMYDYQAMTDILHALVDAYPRLLTLESLGQSEQGREMWLVILNNPDTGSHEIKPAMYIDANVHGNEVQGTEIVLYTIWYLTGAYGHIDRLTELVDRAAFYLVPSVNPDSRDDWFNQPNTPHSPRSGLRPTDNDYDGLLDEDGPEDLDGDGHIGVMWRPDPDGRFRRSEKDPRIFERVEPGEQGQWSFAGWEGIDNDGDGRVNEDGPGGYDMNRNWPSGWQPNSIQYGAGDYPFSYPETRSIGEFIVGRPNIAAGQSYHNSGGMVLRGPGADFREDLYPRGDRRVYDRLGEAGEEMLPFYRYMIIHEDLYTVHGGFVNWLAEGLGIVAFTNELWTSRRILQDDDEDLDTEARMRWTDRLLFGQTFTDWSEYDHPTYGTVLVGGRSKYAGRVPPTFMLEEECHRNFAFTMLHAYHMPLLRIQDVVVEDLGDGLWQITADVVNERIIPTRLQLAERKRIGLPDRMVLESDAEGARVVASGQLGDRVDRTLDPVRHRCSEIPNDAGIPGEGRRTFRYLVTATEGDAVTLRYRAQKARDVEIRIELSDAQ